MADILHIVVFLDLEASARIRAPPMICALGMPKAQVIVFYIHQQALAQQEATARDLRDTLQHQSIK